MPRVSLYSEFWTSEQPDVSSLQIFSIGAKARSVEKIRDIAKRASRILCFILLVEMFCL